MNLMMRNVISLSCRLCFDPNTLAFPESVKKKQDFSCGFRFVNSNFVVSNFKEGGITLSAFYFARICFTFCFPWIQVSVGV